MTDSAYMEFLEEGSKYLRAAKGGIHRPAVFTDEILYNILAMSMEKCFMAILVYNGTLADNHTFTDLINSVKQVVPLNETLVEEILRLEKCQTICSVFDGYARKTPSHNDIKKMLSIVEEVECLAIQTTRESRSVG